MKQIFDYRLYNQVYLRDISLSGIMFYPKSAELRRRYLYRATMQSYGAISKRSAKYDKKLHDEFFTLLEEWGGWEGIAAHVSKNDAKSLEESVFLRWQRGSVAGDLLFLAIGYQTSIRGAAKIYCETHQEGTEHLAWLKSLEARHNFEPDEDDLVGNIWREFRDVAHLFAALSKFSIPIAKPELLTHIFFDGLKTEASAEGEVLTGFDGFCLMAEAYRKSGISFRPAKASKPLLLKDKTWELAIPPQYSDYSIAFNCA